MCSPLNEQTQIIKTGTSDIAYDPWRRVIRLISVLHFKYILDNSSDKPMASSRGEERRGEAGPSERSEAERSEAERSEAVRQRGVRSEAVRSEVERSEA